MYIFGKCGLSVQIPLRTTVCLTVGLEHLVTFITVAISKCSSLRFEHTALKAAIDCKWPMLLKHTYTKINIQKNSFNGAIWKLHALFIQYVCVLVCVWA